MITNAPSAPMSAHNPNSSVFLMVTSHPPLLSTAAPACSTETEDRRLSSATYRHEHEILTDVRRFPTQGQFVCAPAPRLLRRQHSSATHIHCRFLRTDYQSHDTRSSCPMW